MLVPCFGQPLLVQAEDSQSVPITYSVSAKIKLDCNGIVNWMDVDVGQRLSVPNHLEREGYRFVGWMNETTGKMWNFDDPVDENLSLKAVYEPIEGWNENQKDTEYGNTAASNVNTGIESNGFRWMLIGGLSVFELGLVIRLKKYEDEK